MWNQMDISLFIKLYKNCHHLITDELSSGNALFHPLRLSSISCLPLFELNVSYYKYHSVHFVWVGESMWQ